MKTAENAALYYEAGQTPVAMAALSDSGDHLKFTSAASMFSQKSGYAPTIRPDGVISGGAVTVHATNDTVNIASLTCYLAGVKTSVSGTTDTITRGGVGTEFMINSITIDSGGAVAVVTGTGHASAFSETRAAAGGPPLIPVGDIEIAQVRTTDDTAAAVTADEIYSVIGEHLERYDYPSWRVTEGSGYITFFAALPLSHTGVIPKGVFAKTYTPIFAQIENITDVVVPETVHSIASSEIYGRVVGAASASINQGSFTAYLNDGVSDPILAQKNEQLWWKFYPDSNQDPYSLFNGIFGVSRTFPAGDNITAACTISASEEAEDVVA